MKYLLAFIAAFALVAGAAAYLRVRGGGPEPRVSDAGTPEPGSSAPNEQPADEQSGKQPDKPQPKPGPKLPAGITDLANDKDPVSGKAIDDPQAFTADWKGFRAHFADADSLKQFQAHPVRYAAKLNLAMDGPDDVRKVDPSTFRMPVLPDECPFCGQALDPQGEVYILHRGFKIFFGCWMGCPQEFVKDPAQYYEDYGLIEKDGKLALKSKAQEE